MGGRIVLSMIMACLMLISATKLGDLLEETILSYPPDNRQVRSVIAKQHINRGDIVCTIPFENLLSAITLRSDPRLANYVLPLFPQFEYADFAFLMVLVLKEIKKGTEWGRIMDNTDLTSIPAMMTEVEVSNIWGGEVVKIKEILERRRDMLQQVDAFFTSLGPIISHALQLEVPLSRKDVLQAYLLTASRNFGLSHAIPPLREEGARLLMAHPADLMNHGEKDGAVSCEIELHGAGETGLSWVCRTGKELFKGDEVRYFYGKQARERWISEYGFVPVQEISSLQLREKEL